MNESPHPTSTFSIYEDHDQQGTSGQRKSCKSTVADGDDEQLDVRVYLTNLCNGRKK
jgi:hypothetical protein